MKHDVVKSGDGRGPRQSRVWTLDDAFIAAGDAASCALSLAILFEFAAL